MLLNLQFSSFSAVRSPPSWDSIPNSLIDVKRGINAQISKHCQFSKLSRNCVAIFPLHFLIVPNFPSKSEWENKLELSPVQFITFSTICWSPTPFLIRFHAACRVRFAKMSASHRGLRTTVSKAKEIPAQENFLAMLKLILFFTVISGKKASTGVGLFFFLGPEFGSSFDASLQTVSLFFVLWV